MYSVIIIGRPNVGKSSLFNKLTRSNQAIVEDRPGVTRDLREAEAQIDGLDIKLIDSAGLEEAKAGLSLDMSEMAKQAASKADLVLFVLDGKTGLTSDDNLFATWLRKQNHNHLVVANKCEGKIDDAEIAEIAALGLGMPIKVSAAHGLGISNLCEAIKQSLAKTVPKESYTEADGEEYIQISIIGRPNAGKSTLVNALLKEKRMITGEEAGITRDAISVKWEYKGRKIKLVDTAGIRKRARIVDKLEKMTYRDAKQAIDFSHIVVLMIDATKPFEKQDIAIAKLAIDEGRALVVAINKWDMIKAKKEEYMRDVEKNIDKILPELKDVMVSYVSAKNSKNINSIIDNAIKTYDLWNQRIPTAKLNKWLEEATGAHSLPLKSDGRRVRMKFATQIKTRPPTIAVYATNKEISASYINYLRNSFRKYFGLPAVPIRIYIRKNDNPYVK